MNNLKNITLNYRLIITSALATIAVCIIIRGILFAVSSPSVKGAIAMATTVKPETFTELYFDDHNSLPKTIELKKTQSFKFTIHNLEYRTMTYDYEITATDDKASKTLATGSATLFQNQFKTVSESYVLSSASGRMKIQVSLLGRNQTIDFWIEP